MTVALSYLDDFSRVRIAVSGAVATADYALIERSSDGGITWSTVRGGNTVPLSGGACTLDDYEFAPDVLNSYRVSYVDTAIPSWCGVGAPSTANNGPVTPAIPAGLQAGDVMIMLVAASATAITFPVDPAGWSVFTHLGSFRVWGRVYTPGVAAPTVTPSGGVSGNDIMGQIVAFRNVINSPTWTTSLDPTVQQNVNIPGIPVANPDSLIASLLMKRSVTASVSRVGWGSMFTTSQGSSSIGGICTLTSATLPSGWCTMTGGVPAPAMATTMRFDKAPYLVREQATITPNMGRVWLKSPQYPHLNRPLVVTDWSDVERASRSAVVEVVGRTLPVSITDVSGSRRYTLTVTTPTLVAAKDFDAVITAGLPWLLHVPPGCPFPGFYCVLGDRRMRRATGRRDPRRYFDLPLIESAPPAGTLIGTTVLWTDVVSSVASWTALIGAEPTWSDVLSRIGSPSDIIVP